MKKSTYKIALFGMLSATALTLSLLESLIPTAGFMPPGAKAGFSNIATMFAASSMGFVPALAITLIKALFAGVTRGATAFFMSLAGGVLSTASMYVLFKFSNKSGYLLIGVVSALMHNLGQLAVAAIMVGNRAIIGYLPVLLVAGIITGAVTGSVLNAVIPALTKFENFLTRKGGK